MKSYQAMKRKNFSNGPSKLCMALGIDKGRMA